MINKKEKIKKLLQICDHLETLELGWEDPGDGDVAPPNQKTIDVLRMLIPPLIGWNYPIQTVGAQVEEGTFLRIVNQNYSMHMEFYNDDDACYLVQGSGGKILKSEDFDWDGDWDADNAVKIIEEYF